MTQPVDRLKESTRRVVEAHLPDYVYRGQYEARVLTVTPGQPVRISCAPTSSRWVRVLGPALANIVLWPGPSGGYAVPVVGSLVRVAFVASGNSWLPTVVGLDPSVTPTTITMGSPASTPVAPSPWAIGLDAALVTFAAGINPGNLAAKGAALAAAIPLLPPPSTTIFKAT